MHTVPAVSKLLDLEGQSILVTGASGNIGQGIARRLNEAGATIIAHCHRNFAAVSALIDSLGRGEAVRADLSDEAAVVALFERIHPHGVVNNAATQHLHALPGLALDDWRAMQQSTLDSAFLVTQYAAKSWRRQSLAGAIVNIASIEALDPAVGHAHYASSKAGVLMFTRAAALEYGGDDIRVNAVSPGLIDRPGLADEWPQGVQRWQDRVPLGRVGVPNDVADAVLFLLSPAARWISGANLIVDGGMSAQSRW